MRSCHGYRHCQRVLKRIQGILSQSGGCRSHSVWATRRPSIAQTHRNPPGTNGIQTPRNPLQSTLEVASNSAWQCGFHDVFGLAFPRARGSRAAQQLDRGRGASPCKLPPGRLVICPAVGQAPLFGVSCPSTSLCVAVGCYVPRWACISKTNFDRSNCVLVFGVLTPVFDFYEKRG